MLIDDNEFLGMDLAREFPQPIEADLAVCLEFAEHMPNNKAHDIVDFLARSANVVLFSAAIPGQMGSGHINCKPPRYWKGLFSERGYTQFDTVRPKILCDQRVHYWYRQNIYLYVSEERTEEMLRTCCPVPSAVEFLPGDFELIHEKILRRYREEAGVKTLIKKLPRAAAKAISRRFGR